MQGAAAEAAQTAAYYGAFYEDPTFWAGVGFLILIGAVSRTVYRVAALALDDRAEAIRNQILEAERLQEEAQGLLADYRRKQREAEEEAKQISQRAKAEAERLARELTESLGKTLKRRKRQALDRIAQAEAAAISEVRSMAANLAMEATQQLLIEMVEGGKADELVNAAIKDLPEEFNKSRFFSEA